MTDTQDRLGAFDVRERTRTHVPQDQLAVLFAVHADERRNSSASARDRIPPSMDIRSFVERDIAPRLRGLGSRGFESRGRGEPKDLICSATTSPPVDLVFARAVTEVGDYLLESNRAAACDTVEALRRDGCTFDSIFLHVLAPVASYVRDLWTDDICGYAEAIVALLDLQAVLRHFAPDFRAEMLACDTGRRIMVASPDARQEVGTTMFGLMMLSEFFRRDGWEPWIEADLSSAVFAASVREQWFDVVELLVGREANLDGVASGIKVIRRGSPNRSIGIVVCGQIFVEHPEFVRLVGADVFATDPRSSVTQARNFMSLATSPVRLT